MKLIFGEDQRVLDWVAERIRYYTKGPADQCATIGFEDDGRLVAGVVFSRLTYDRDGVPNDMDFAIAVDAGAQRFSRRIVKTIFRYAFGQSKCRRVTTYIASDNERSWRGVEGLGFKREGCLREAIQPGVDLFIYGLLRNECRFWREA